MEELAAKINDISLKAERMERFVRLLLQEQANMEEQIEKLEAVNAQILLENKELKERETEGTENIGEELHFLQEENKRLLAENTQLKKSQQENVARRVVDIEAQDAMKIKIETYIKEIDACLKIFGD